MKKILLSAILALTFLMVGCTSVETVTPLERAQMRTATMDSEYRMTFKALMTTLENEGYTIENTDMDSGLIKASIMKNAVDKWDRLVGVTGVKKSALSSTLTKINSESTRVRINIREETETHQGAYDYSDVKEINDPFVYRGLFNKLRVEIARYKAMR
ncbi:MAG: hypothetical protein Q7K48_00095 [Fusobacterium sp. JB021]|nr:hypothetical protein [Fusobacterium sp. JB020]MDP0492706.1 hypothetical protein [Fusobacterium sp. JB021]